MRKILSEPRPLKRHAHKKCPGNNTNDDLGCIQPNVAQKVNALACSPAL